MGEDLSNLPESAKKYVGKRGLPGDVYNNIMVLKMNLAHEEDWPDVRPAKTYAEYMREIKFNWNQEVARAVIAASDTELVARHDAIIARINDAIGDKVSTQTQADNIRNLIDELTKLIYDRQ